MFHFFANKYEGFLFIAFCLDICYIQNVKIFAKGIKVKVPKGKLANVKNSQTSVS